MKIIIFSAKSCAYCVSLKHWLDEKEVKYINYNVDQSPMAAQTMVKLSGQMGVPFSIVEYENGKIEKILGFDRQKFESVLAKA
jgi:glutaredoxin